MEAQRPLLHGGSAGAGMSWLVRTQHSTLNNQGLCSRELNFWQLDVLTNGINQGFSPLPDPYSWFTSALLSLLVSTVF